MSIDAHIKFEGVEGESTHKDHKGEVELVSWGWALDNASAAHGGGMGKGKGVPQAFTFTHRYDKASPVLAKHCASGKHFGTVVLTSRKSGEGQKDFFKLTLKEVVVSHIDWDSSSGGEMVETVKLTFSDIETVYKPQDDKGGLGGEVKFGWNIKTTEIR